MVKFQIDLPIFLVIMYTDTHNTQTDGKTGIQTELSTLQWWLINRNYKDMSIVQTPLIIVAVYQPQL